MESDYNQERLKQNLHELKSYGCTNNQGLLAQVNILLEDPVATRLKRKVFAFVEEVIDWDQESLNRDLMPALTVWRTSEGELNPAMDAILMTSLRFVFIF